MITKFDSLFAGHADLETSATAAPRSTSGAIGNAHLASALSKAENIAKLMDGLGYNRSGWPSTISSAKARSASPTADDGSASRPLRRNIKIGCGFNIAPMWHPLRLAEDYAMADILTRGRVVFGVGRGYHTREVETFGAPLIDQEANRELFEEQIDIIFKAFNEEFFSHKGKHYTLPPRCRTAATR